MRKNISIKEMLGESKSEAVKFHEDSAIKSFSSQKKLTDWPTEWKRVHFKSYPRFKRFSLKHLKFNKGSNLFQILKNRRSTRDFNSYRISKNEISKLLLFSAGITTINNSDWDQSQRAYPSAGARYPLEIYPVIFNSKDLDVGVYHYNVKCHALELLLSGQFKNKLDYILSQDWVYNASVIFIITAVLDRSRVKYGERAYRYCLLEAGHIAQNIYLISTGLDLKCCAIGGFIDKEINNLLDLNIKNEFAVYILAIGN